ncbi:acyl carrier protein [Globicatella sulfidifaciens]
MTNKDKYYEVFSTLFEVDKTELNEEFTFVKREDWDSLIHMSLITELETAFDVLFDTDELLNFGSFFNGIKILEGHGIVMDDSYGE